MTAEQRKALNDLTATASFLCGVVIGRGDQFAAEVEEFRDARAAVREAFYGPDDYEGKKPYAADPRIYPHG